MHVRAVRTVREYAVRREQTQHPIERVGREPRMLGDRSRRRAGGADGIRRSAFGDDVQTAGGDMRLREVRNDLGRISNGWGRRLRSAHCGYWLAARLRSMA